MTEQAEAVEAETFESDFASPDGALDTFDEGPYTQDTGETQVESFDEQGSVDGVSTDSQVNQLEEKEEVIEAKEEEQATDSEEEDAESDKDDSEAAKQSDDGDKAEKLPEKEDGDADVKTLKAFRDGKAYEIPQDAEIKVKIDGKNVKVPLSELRDNYSGKVAYDEKFSSLNEEVKQYKEEKTQYTSERQALQDDMVQVRQLAEKGLKGEESPLAFMEKMLDFMKIDSYDYNRALREYMSEEVNLLNQLAPEQREAYYIQLKNEHLAKQQESLTARLETEQTRAELNQKLSGLREAHGVSEDVYNGAYGELSEMGYENLQPEQIIDYATTKPLVESAKSLLDPYTERLDDSDTEGYVREIVGLFKDGADEQEIAELLAQELKTEELVKVIEEKVGKAPKASTAKKKAVPQNNIESFDDFDFGNNYY